MAENQETSVTEEKKVKEPGKVALFLDKFFHIYERGSTVKKEISAGISMFLISVCALFMNITILTSAFSDSIPYLGMYLGATIVSFIGTLLIGLIANRPLVQCASLSLSSVFISMLGANSGLTYANLLAVTFICAIVYVLLTSIPRVNTWLATAIPDPVKKALPVAIGLYVMYMALDQMGALSLFDGTINLTARPTYTVYCVIIGLIGILITVLLVSRKSKHPYLYGFLISTLLFYLIAACTDSGGELFTAVYSLNRIYVGLNVDPNGEIYLISGGLSELQLGTVFTEGFDFSAFTEAGGNTFMLFVEGILLFLFAGMYESQGSLEGARMYDENWTDDDNKTLKRALFCNSIANVCAPIFGVAPISVGKQSSIGSGDGGRTGLTSVVCSIGFLIAMFTWAIFVFFATFIPVVPEYGHAGFLFPAVVNSLFQTVDAVMFVVGLHMLKGCRDVDFKDISYLLPFGVTIGFAVFTSNIVIGAACGVLAYTLSNLITFKKEKIKEISIPTAVLTVFMAIYIVFAII